MSIDVIFNPPLATDSRSEFSAKAFDTASKYNPWAAQANALAVAVNGAALAAGESAAASAASRAAAAASEAAASGHAQAAAASAGATEWVPGAVYAVGARHWSPLNQQLYRRLVAGSGLTDPSQDTVNWGRVWIEPPMVTAESFFF